MGEKWCIILLAALFCVGGVLAAAGKCVDGLDEQYSICGGSTLNSGLGFGAVELCEDCYICGVADNVCPEDFNDGTSFTNCSRCADPDCLVNLHGKVHVAGNPALGVRDVAVTAQILHYENWQTLTTMTDAYGDYSFNAPRGKYKVIASSTGYDTAVVDFPYYQGSNLTDYELNISLENGSCHADCTGAHIIGQPNRCNAACAGFYDGIDVCAFSSYTNTSTGITYLASDACDGIPIGASRVVDVDDSGDNSLVVDCCEGSFTWEYRPPVTLQTTDRIKNLVKKQYVLPISGESSPGKLVIVIYNK